MALNIILNLEKCDLSSKVYLHELVSFILRLSADYQIPNKLHQLPCLGFKAGFIYIDYFSIIYFMATASLVDTISSSTGLRPQ